MYQGKFLSENRDARVAQLRQKRANTSPTSQQPVPEEPAPQETMMMPKVRQPAAVEPERVPAYEERKRKNPEKRKKGPRVSIADKVFRTQIPSIQVLSLQSYSTVY